MPEQPLLCVECSKYEDEYTQFAARIKHLPNSTGQTVLPPRAKDADVNYRTLSLVGARHVEMVHTLSSTL